MENSMRFVSLSAVSSVVMTFEEFKTSYAYDFEEEFDGNISEREWRIQYDKYLNDFDQDAEELLVEPF